MKKACFWLVLLLLLVPSAGFGREEFQAYQVVKVSTPPRIDGVLNDDCWKKAEKITGFIQMDSARGLATEQTVFSVLCDDQNLYFGVECRESKVKEMVTKNKEHDSDVWADDCIELFIDPGHTHKDYFHFAVNSIGAQYDGRVMDVSWNAPWQAKASVGEKAWFLEVAVPFSSLEAKPQTGDLWGLNVNREHYAGGKVEFSGWSNTPGGFHLPDRFGHALFGSSYAGYLKKTVLPEAEKKREALGLIFQENPEEAKPYRDKFAETNQSLEKVEASSRGAVTSGEFASCYQAAQDILKNYEKLEYDLKFATLLGG